MTYLTLKNHFVYLKATFLYLIQRDKVKWLYVALIEGRLRAAKKSSNNLNRFLIKRYHLSIFFLGLFLFETAVLRSYCGCYLAICHLCFKFQKINCFLKTLISKSIETNFAAAKFSMFTESTLNVTAGPAKLMIVINWFWNLKRCDEIKKNLLDLTGRPWASYVKWCREAVLNLIN